MFNIIDKMNSNLVVVSRWRSPFPRSRSVVLVDLIDFNVHGSLPFLVTIGGIGGASSDSWERGYRTCIGHVIAGAWLA
jgi:hypothetical protein